MSRIGWLLNYRRQDLPSDATAGLVVAVMLIPQAMAYGMLAGLPPQVGLYASVVPLLLYPLFASSRYLAVGPVAVVSMLVAVAVADVGESSAFGAIEIAVTLAFLVGLFQVAMGMLRVGFLVNFLSHAVIAGFTSAAALVIGLSQLKHILGVKVPRGGNFFDLLRALAEASGEANPVTLIIGVSALVLLFVAGRHLEPMLASLGLRPPLASLVCKAAPLIAVGASTAAVYSLKLNAVQAVAIVGDIPAGLPSWSTPGLDWTLLSALVPAALAISFVGFMESYAVAQSLAIQHRQKVDANQELIALGVANFGAAMTSGYPVTGGFSRSMVNHSAGARTGLASIISAGLIALTLVVLTPFFYFLPMAVLAAVILVAVAKLIDLREPSRLFRYSKSDGAAHLATFGSVLWFGLERGVLVGAATAMVLHLWRTSRPHVAIVGRVGETEHFRNVLRHSVKTWDSLLLVRIDESLYFANASYLEDFLLRAAAERPTVRDVVLIASAINSVDGSALETLEGLNSKLKQAGVTLHLAEVKGPVMDRLERTELLQHLRPGQVFLSTHEAVDAIVGEDGATSASATGGGPSPAGGAKAELSTALAGLEPAHSKGRS